MASVSFEGATKRFGETVAVDALTLRVDNGEFMVLVGPSGCGKTTALRLLAAGAVIVATPVVVVYVLLQRHFVRGMLTGAVKG